MQREPITHDELVEWYKRETSAFKPDGRRKPSKPRQRLNIRRFGLLVGCKERAAWRFLHNQEAFEGSKTRLVIDMIMKVPGALDHRLLQIGDEW